LADSKIWPIPSVTGIKRTRFGLTLVLVFATISSSSSPHERGVAKIEIGPNIRVSDKPMPYLEPCISAHPKDKEILIISASRAVHEKASSLRPFLALMEAKPATAKNGPHTTPINSLERLATYGT